MTANNDIVIEIVINWDFASVFFFVCAYVNFLSAKKYFIGSRELIKLYLHKQ